MMKTGAIIAIDILFPFHSRLERLVPFPRPYNVSPCSEHVRESEVRNFELGIRTAGTSFADNRSSAGISNGWTNVVQV